MRRPLALAVLVASLLTSCGGATGPAGTPALAGGEATAPGGAAAPGETTGEAALPGATAAIDPVAGGRAPIRFFRQAITDPAADNVAAITFLVPEGWQYDASVQWMPEWSRVAFLQTRLADPTTGITIEWLPIQDFIWFPAPPGFDAPIGGNYQGKMYVPPVTDPAQFVTNFWMPGVLSHLQTAQLVSVDQVPAVAEDFKKQFGGPADAFAYRLRYEFNQDGQAWEEDVSFALLYSGTPDLTSWYVQFASAARAPKGELDRNAGLISTVVASRTTTPEWEATYRVVRQLFTQGIQQQMADTEAFGRTLAQHRAEIAALQEQVTQERLASEDHIAELQRQTLGGVETYDDPVSGVPVELPVGWNEYWVNDRGEYLTSDQAGFDPNTLNDGAWQRLQPRTR